MDDNSALVATWLDFPCKAPGRAWALVGQGTMENGDCVVALVDADAANGADARTAALEGVGRFDGRTGNVFALDEDAATHAPAVLNVGNVDGATGQLKARQPAGNYLRVCRWDRLDTSPKLHPGAMFRTLPQCGCGGYLGVPKFFETFAEMSAYVYCLFYLGM